MRPAVRSITEIENNESEPLNTLDVVKSPAKIESSSERLTPRQEYIEVVNEDFEAREEVYDTNLSVTKRLQAMAGRLWGYFTSEDPRIREKAEKELTAERIKELFETDKVLQQKKEAHDDAERNAALKFVAERKFNGISAVEKARVKKEVRVGRITGIVDKMVSARAQWINMHFDSENIKEDAGKMNKLTFYQQDQMGKLREVYDASQALFDYKVCELQKTVLQGRLYQYFSIEDAQARGNMDLAFSSTLDFPSHQLRNIMWNKELSLDEKVEQAMALNRQDKNMEYLKTLIEPGLLADTSKNSSESDEE